MPALRKPLIRAASQADAPALASLLAELGYPCTPAEAARRLDLLAGPGDAVFVADDNGAVVGLVTIHMAHMLHLQRPWARVTELVVTETHRRRGVGDALLAHAEQWCRKAGAAGIELTCRPTRTEAHTFYTRRGYAERPKRFFKSLD
jgi:GNAT superfamily N-acetyltransferase